MDFLKARSFVKNLKYDIHTIRYLLDYGRIKETVPIIEKILYEIDSFRSDHLGNNPGKIFSEDFWNDKLPQGSSISGMLTNIKKFSQTNEDLEKIEYASFVKNVFTWSDLNFSKLRPLTKSPLRKRIEKIIICSLFLVLGLSLSVLSAWTFYTRDWGLKGSFYQGNNFDQYLYSGRKMTINFSTSKEMDERLPPFNFSARWQGKLLVPKEGVYTIFTTSDDGDRVIIDGKLLLNDWGPHPPDDYSSQIFLSRGPHQITVEYYQLWGGAALKLYWAIDNSKKEIIPARYLRH